MNATTIPEVLGVWRKRAQDLRKWAAAEGAAAALETAADELEAILATQDGHLLSLQEASRLSGYSEDHLGRLIRERKIPNAGRRYSPKIRRADLPLRPKAVARPMRDGYDPSADARALMSRQGDR
jgi:hypothetical protein